ncbi:MAG: stage III sporulation protein AA [Eubacterium sp.]|nr:stage III sporulation protein AA [Eubacterium sp.]
MQDIIDLFPLHMRDKLVESGIFEHAVEELRVRIGQPILAWTNYGEESIAGLREYRITKEDMRQMVSFISKCSLYAFEEEIKKGYLTLEGGHRVGLGGQVVLDETGVQTIRPITFLNIRIAHQVLGCAVELTRCLFTKRKPGNVLIMSAPGHGKTTMLRDMIRLLSDGIGSSLTAYKIAIIDERSEIAGCYNGIPQNQIGTRSDVLDGCPKALGMMMMVRSMSPDYLAVDEIGSVDDLEAMKYATNCGCGILATMHCPNIEELPQKPFWNSKGFQQMFDYYVVLEKTKNGRSWSIYNREFKLIDVSE